MLEIPTQPTEKRGKATPWSPSVGLKQTKSIFTSLLLEIHLEILYFLEILLDFIEVRETSR